jgi:hypothetical protein
MIHSHPTASERLVHCSTSLRNSVGMHDVDPVFFKSVMCIRFHPESPYTTHDIHALPNTQPKAQSSSALCSASSMMVTCQEAKDEAVHPFRTWRQCLVGALDDAIINVGLSSSLLEPCSLLTDEIRPGEGVTDFFSRSVALVLVVYCRRNGGTNRRAGATGFALQP